MSMKRSIYQYFACTLAGMALLAACKKETVNSSGKSPYGDPVLPSIVFAENAIDPGKGAVNDEIVIKGTGFRALKDKLEMQFNGIAGRILEVTDSSVRLQVPEMASSGPVNAKLGQEFYFGPFFRVLGPMQMDTVFPSVRGADRTVNAIIPVGDNKYLVGGSFTNFDQANIAGGTNRVARMNADGTLDRSFTYGHFTGPTGGVNALLYLPSEQKYLVAGSFNRYSRIEHVYSIARLNFNGTLDSSLVNLPSQFVATRSSLTGGVRGNITDMHLQADGKIIITGNFRYYVKPDYNLVSVVSGADSLHLDSTAVNYIARLHPDGSLDSSYHYDLVNHRGRETVNGFISRSILQPDGKLVIVGNFTKYNNQTATRIARLNADGSLDNSFNPGAGPDIAIQDVVLQPDGKLLIAGGFNRYNGVKAMRAARLMPNGDLDVTFSIGDGPDGSLFRVGLVPGANGAILLSGNFRKFAGVPRNNFVTINADGSLHKTYNSNGGITLNIDADLGGVNCITPMQGGTKALLLGGSFTVFDYRTANRIMKLKYE